MTVRLVIFIILELLIIYAFFGGWIRRKIASEKQRLRFICRDYAQHLKRIIRHDRDLLPGKSIAELKQLFNEARDTSRCGKELSAADIRGRISRFEEQGEKLLANHRKRNNWLHETMEVLVVALALAFGFRALFLQPFQIPTGSMKPTLYGIHFVADEDMQMPSLPKKIVDFLHFSNRYVDHIVQRSGTIDGLKEGLRLPILKTSTVRIEGIDYQLPGDLKTVEMQLTPFLNNKEDSRSHFNNNNHNLTKHRFKSGEILTRGYLQAGDHVFVNRLSQNFFNIKRGDIIVFRTDNLTIVRETNNGQSVKEMPLNGRFYIKRLVGMPGDKLMIDDNNRLQVQPKGAKSFKIVDGQFASDFERIYSKKNGYHGYIADMGTAEYRLDKPYTVPEDHYFMLGDNSPSSQDSRFWGPVPRKNIVGRASIVWWPLSHRWGVLNN